MSAQDDLFAPILPDSVESKIRDLVRRVMSTPQTDSFIDNVTHDIVTILRQHGITNEQDIADVVHRIIRELGGSPEG